jgi:NTE family protein
MLEAMDELGIEPSIIVGTSIGAIYGAAYAAGLDARLIRAHTEETLSGRLDLVRQLVSSRASVASRLFNLLPIRAGLLSPTALLDSVLPGGIPNDFAQLRIPLAVVATGFHAQDAVLIDKGPLRPAVAASMALPALFEPVMLGGLTLIDGGLVNPLPFDLIGDRADIVVAIDVSGGAREEGGGGPGALGALLASTQILQRAIVREKLKSVQPDIYVDSTVEQFNLIEFHRFKDIIASAQPAKAYLKRQLERVLAAETVEARVAVAPQTLAEPPDPQPSPEARPRRIRLGRKKSPSASGGTS